MWSIEPGAVTPTWNLLSADDTGKRSTRLRALSTALSLQVTRSDALVVNGRLAVRMVGAATLLLLVAGVIEGFISAGEKDLLFRVGISGASILLLVAYLLNGARYVADLKERIQPSER